MEPNIKEVHAHSSIICAHCLLLRNILINAKKENSFYIIKKENLNETIFKPILK